MRTIILFGTSPHLSLLIIPYLLLGAGWAFILPASFGTGLASLLHEMAGVGMGSLGTLHNFGGTVGLALSAAFGYFGAMGVILGISIFTFFVIIVGLKLNP